MANGDSCGEASRTWLTSIWIRDVRRSSRCSRWVRRRISVRAVSRNGRALVVRGGRCARRRRGIRIWTSLGRTTGLRGLSRVVWRRLVSWIRSNARSWRDRCGSDQLRRFGIPVGSWLVGRTLAARQLRGVARSGRRQGWCVWLIQGPLPVASIKTTTLFTRRKCVGGRISARRTGHRILLSTWSALLQVLGSLLGREWLAVRAIESWRHLTAPVVHRVCWNKSLRLRGDWCEDTFL